MLKLTNLEVQKHNKSRSAKAQGSLNTNVDIVRGPSTDRYG